MGRRRTYKQGIYNPENPHKYVGNKKIIYRSSYELKFMIWCDRNHNVIEWGSENYIIPYIHPGDGKVHRYFIDNYVLIKEGDKLQRYLIEIKPKKQVDKPTATARKQKKTFIKECQTWSINQRKWEHARKYCNTKGFKFLILTEKELGIT